MLRSLQKGWYPCNGFLAILTSLMHTLLTNLSANIPSARFLAIAGPVSLLWAFGLLALAGYLKMQKRWKTGYTRKLFHFGVFGTVVAVNSQYGLPGVYVFGAMTTLAIGYALVRGEGYYLYEAMAREKDAPHRTRYIIEPYLATLVGGLLANQLFPQTVGFGYLVAGLGDAVAEPVGTRFGRHRYRVPTLDGTVAERSLEGSASVFIVSSVALLMCLGFSAHFTLTPASGAAVVLIAGLSTVAEAFSPHGWDNAVLQVLPAWLGMMLIPIVY